MLRAAALALLTAAGAAAQTPSGLSGSWSGAAVTDGVPRLFTLDLDVTSDADGDRLAAVLTQPYDGWAQFPYPVAYEPGRLDGELVAGLFGDEMRLVADLTDGTLRGTVVTDGDTTATVFLQRILPAPLPRVAVREARFRAGQDTLAARLLLPDGPGPHPAAVLVEGRGGSAGDMRPWGDRLARAGVAALVIEPRGTGRSGGDAATTTDTDRFAAVRAALDWMRTRPEIDGARLGLLSYSAGGWVAPVVAAERDDVAFWVSLAGPAEALPEQQGHVTTAFMRASGDAFSDAEVADAFAYQSEVVRLAWRGAPWTDYADGNATARAARWAEHALIPDSLDQPDLDYYRRRPGFDARAALAALRVPTLAVFGGADSIVPPEDNAPLWRRLAAQAGNDDLTVVVIADADHGLGVAGGAVGDGAWPLGYRRSWSRPASLFETVIGWTRARTGLSDAASRRP